MCTSCFSQETIPLPPSHPLLVEFFLDSFLVFEMIERKKRYPDVLETGRDFILLA
jgi:hypothetical protein